MVSWIADFCIRWRVAVLAVIALITVVLGYFAMQVEIKTIFTDLQPAGHPYVQTNEKFKNTFGGANVVSIMVEAKKGDIFNLKTLGTIKQITDDLQHVDAVNQFQIVSLASKKLKNVLASNFGIESLPIMWPELPKGADGIEKVKKDVISNPMVYGNYVSYDLKSALITVDFIDRLIDYDKVLPQIRAVIKKAENPDVNIKVVGQPILAGLVMEYLPETLHIVFLIVAVIALILLISKGTLRGMFLPLVSGLVSGIWIFGVMRLLGFNLDPLAIVITFIISARAISHAVQLNAAFNAERAEGGLDARDAARIALAKLFRPGMLGLATDMGAMLVVAMTPIPLLKKAAIIGAMWIGAMVVCTIIMVPVILSWCTAHHEKRILPWNVNRPMKVMLRWCGQLSTTRSTATFIIVGALAVLLVSGYFAKDINIGDSHPGSPILWPDSKYNQDDSAINSHFPGSDRMFLVVSGDEENTMKKPEVLDNISRFQQYIEAQPEIGGTVSLADVIRPVNMILHEGNPRYFKLGDRRARQRRDALLRPDGVGSRGHRSLYGQQVQERLRHDDVPRSQGGHHSQGDPGHQGLRIEKSHGRRVLPPCRRGDRGPGRRQRGNFFGSDPEHRPGAASSVHLLRGGVPHDAGRPLLPAHGPALQHHHLQLHEPDQYRSQHQHPACGGTGDRAGRGLRLLYFRPDQGGIPEYGEYLRKHQFRAC